MENFKTLNLKSSYETGKNDLIEEFYAPVLRCAISYDRIAGFFSSSCLAIAAKGISGFIKNKGKMHLIACPRLDSKDVEILKTVSDNPGKFLEDKIAGEFENIEDGFQNNHIMALGWMIANGFLEIRIALVNLNGKFCTDKQIEQTGIFHQKVGILTDIDGNKISFSGSINETASGWLNNVEEFKVFKSWNGENKYLVGDEMKFQEFWDNNRDNVHTYSLPESVKNKLIEKSREFEIEKILVKHYKKYSIQRKTIDALHLFFYQNQAVKKWRDNRHKLLFQMATGTGKTRTALGCMADLMLSSEKLIVIVSCPQGTLSLQWKTEIESSPLKFEKKIVIDGTNKNWKTDLQEVVLRVSTGFYDSVVIFTTHTTGAKNEFTSVINSSSDKIKYLFVGDEAHGLGACESKKGLLSRYDYRVGLSATPSRWFDESGTKVLEDYFGNDSFEFTINDALTTLNPATGKTFLVPYTYNLDFIDLTESELTQYQKISLDVKKLSRFSKNSDEYAERMERLLFKRANIVKDAENKYDKLNGILDEMDDIQDLIIFVSPEQKDRVLTLLFNKRIAAHEFTQAVGTVSDAKYNGLTERQHIINCFKSGHYKVLVAIKCLDEGIDIPSAKNAILMASSTNPREYVQRIGRVIRQAPNKKDANIWDITIRPCADKLAVPELQEFEKQICEKEKARIFDISENAKNNTEALKILFEEMGD
ncbi:MAG: DEAD/DEAH box helicase family protein [Anaerostipes sp.]|nr:DEAD/DEAH box helicase family protein [Anaerostipes sp.]